MSAATTSPSAPPAPEALGLRAFVRRWRAFIIALTILLVVAVLGTLAAPRHSKVPYALDNPSPTGAQALGRLLQDQGVSVETVADVSTALEKAGPGTTVAVLFAGELSEDQRRALASSGADVVVVGSIYQDLSGLGSMSSTGSSEADETTLQPWCADPDAQAAQELLGSRGSVEVPVGSRAVGCFPVGDGTSFAYASEELSSGGTLRVIGDARIVRNDFLATSGRAALSVRALGHHRNLLWLDASRTAPPSLWDTTAVPPWLPVLGLQLILTAAVLAVVQGRRFGRLVTEDLPVIVRATETTEGRGHLYRRVHERDRASQVLRAGTATRLAHRLGLPRGAGRLEVIHAVARASARPPTHIETLLYGPVPASDRDLADLATQLDHLENEVIPR